jgi:phage shock protein PspC (stress-responsive transcriptional regulator)
MPHRPAAAQAWAMTQVPPSAQAPGSAFWQRFRDLGALRRSADHRAVAGVAEGLSEHFDVDPIIVRVLFVALTFFGGAGIIVYLALWLTVPQEGNPDSVVSRRARRDPQTMITAGLAIGGIVGAAAFLGSISWAVPHPFPILLVVVLVAIVAVAYVRRRDPHEPPVTRVAPDDDHPAAAWWQRSTPPSAAAPLASYAPAPPPRPKSHLFALTMAAVSIAIAALWVVDATTPLDPQPSVYPGIALAIIAVGLLVGTWWGRSRGLIAMGVLLSLVTAGAAAAGPGPYGDIQVSPRLARDLHPTYKLGIGQLTLHLEDVADVARLDGRTTSISGRFGRVLVIVPTSLAVTVNATVDHGEIEGPRLHQRLDNGGESAMMTPPDEGRPAMVVDVHVRFGQIEIERAACPGAGNPAPGESIRLWNGGFHVPAACH